jgi:hypothetical protein
MLYKFIGKHYTGLTWNSLNDEGNGIVAAPVCPLSGRLVRLATD